MSTSGTAKNRKILTPKLAEKLFDTLRDHSAQAFRELKGVLVRWQRSDNQTECFEKMQDILTPHPDITKNINQYLEQQTRFTVHNTFPGKIEELFKYLRFSHNDYLTKILMALQNVASEIGSNDEEQVKCRFLEIFKDNEEIYNRARNILEDVEVKPKPKEPQPKKQMIMQNYDEDDGRKYVPKPKTQNKRLLTPPPEQVVPRNKTQYMLNTGINPEQMMLMLKFDKRSSSFVKLVNLYQLCILSKNEVLSILQDVIFDSEDQAEMIKDIIELRENERRKTINLFKPLNDIDFTNSTRITPSYVEMPWSYPVSCRNKTKELKGILNDKWVSVPYGSEHSHFSIRIKNQYEELLLKSEDERYQFDLYSNRLRKACDILWRVISEPDLSDETATKLISSVICMGVIQALYKNAQKEQKEDLQVCMKSNRVETCNIIRQRMADQLAAMSNIREVHGLRAWHEVADKNYYKSLDRKCFELKKNEREYIKQAHFDAELQERLKQLKNKDYKIRYFDENLSLWRLLNTFQGISRTEKCEVHANTPVPQYDIESVKHKNLLPILFMSFGDVPSREAVYSFLHYHVNNMVQGEAEKTRVKKCGAKVFEGILNTKLKVMSLREGFNEDFMEMELTSLSHISPDATIIPETHCIETPVQGLWDQDTKTITIEMEFQELKEGRICVKKEVNDELGYLPIKSENQTVIFMTPLIYGIVRTIYTLYQRMLKAREILYNYKLYRNFNSPLGDYKFKLFKELLMQYIKAKETSKYEDFVEQLFGKESAYLFSTMHKLVESLTKSIQLCLGCQFSGKLLDLNLQSDLKHLIQNEYLYLMMVNKMSINSTSSDKIIRFHFDTGRMFASINYLTSCYKLMSEEGKDKLATNKVQDLQRNVQLFTTLPIAINQQFISKNGKKKDKRTDTVQQLNNMELMCLDQNLKLYSKMDNEDFLCYIGKRCNMPKAIRKELKRKAKMDEIIGHRLK